MTTKTTFDQSSPSEKTLIILNPNAGSGRAGRLWSKIEPMLWKELGALVVAVTQRPEEVAAHLDKAYSAGLRRVIAIGGDGTNHALVNELIRLNAENPGKPLMTFGSLPIGTGRDWSRTLGIPSKPGDAVRWIKSAHPVPVDVGRLTTPNYERNFLNVASVGISGEIDRRINQKRTRWPWTFYLSTMAALTWWRPPRMTVRLDEEVWYDGPTYIVAIANGQSFGHGMKVAPEARYDDGLFDVVLAEGMPRLRIITALNTIYSGTHVLRSDVHTARAKRIEVESSDGPITLDLDGEYERAPHVRFDALPGVLNVLAKA